MELILRLALTLCFIFDKFAEVHGYIHLLSSVLAVMIVYQRVTQAIKVKESLHYLSVLFETMIAWLLISIGAHRLALAQI